MTYRWRVATSHVQNPPRQGWTREKSTYTKPDSQGYPGNAFARVLHKEVAGKTRVLVGCRQVSSDMRVKGLGVAPGWQMPNPRVTQKLLKCPIPGTDKGRKCTAVVRRHGRS